MINYRKILELNFSGTSQRTISATVGSSRDTIREVVKRAKDKDLTELEEEMTNSWLEGFLFPEKAPKSKGRFEEDWAYVHQELGKKHMTLSLLHKEYSRKAIENQSVPYSYRSYCYKYNKYAHKYKVTMPLRRKPGEDLQVDWAGSTLYLKDQSDGSEIPVYIFVATLAYSQYFYVEGFLDMKSASWITGHIHAFEYFKGVPQVVVPDNLKTGVVKTDYAEPTLNATYQEFANYYDTIIIPARVKHPQDKASVESHVGYASRQIIAALRDVQCFYLEELNKLILEKINELNQAPFQKKLGSRQSVFLEEESAYLKPLREPSFQLTDWRVAKVHPNYHIQVDRNYYSVPYEYVQCQVDVRLTEDLLEVYFNQSRIASHKRMQGIIGQYSTNKNHMPDHHRLYYDHTPTESLQWAQGIGPHTEELVQKILDQQTEKRALKMISGIQRLKDKHSSHLIETTSQILLDVAQQPTLKVFKEILKKQANQLIASPSQEKAIQDENYGFTRGSDYFGRRKP